MAALLQVFYKNNIERRTHDQNDSNRELILHIYCIMHQQQHKKLSPTDEKFDW